MKKLMTVLAGVATALFAFGAVGDVTVPPNGFESYESGDVFDPEVQEGSSTYWYAASKDDGNVISNYVESGTAVPTLATGVTRPDTFVDQTNSKFLSLDTSTPLFRSVQANSQDGTFTGSTIGTDGIYLDTLVKFTAADEVFGEDALQQGVDKIAIEYVAREEETTTEEGVTTVTVPALANFVIRAGYIGANELAITNYLAAVPANFDVDAWHRLTVRAIADIGGGNVGFVVYVDQNPLAYSTDVACGDNFTATGLAAEFYTDELHAVYPSAVDVGDDKNKIAAASFSGTGFIDDVVFTTTKPDFIVLDPDVTVEWDANVATLTLNGEAVDSFVAGEAGSAKITPIEGVVTVAATFANGYVYGACETDGNGAWNVSTKQFTGLTPGETCSIYGMLPYFKVGDEYFDDFSDALDAAVTAGTAQNPATIQLMADCDSALAFSEGNIILDLAGYDIQGGADADYSLVNAGANLTIINTGDEASIKTPLSGATIAMYQDAAGFTTVEAGTFEGVIMFNVDNEETFPQTYMLLKGGKFIDPDYATEGTFYLAACVQSGLTATYDSETSYVQVGEGGEQPTTLTLTITDDDNAESTVTINGEPAETGAEIQANDVIVITATAKSGFEYASAPDGWTLSEGAITKSITVVDESVAVTIPAPTAVVIGTYTVTVTPNANATYTAAYKEGGDAITPDNDVLTVTVGQTIVITATPGSNYEYAEAPTGWTAGQNGEITIEVSAAAEIAIPAPTAKQQGGYPSYIEDETAQGKYDTWKSYVEGESETVGDGEELEDAYLLNCKPSEVEAAKAAFKFTSISYDADKKVWVTATTTSYNDREYNGTVTVKQYSDVGCTTESETGTFFKAVLQ